MVQRMRVAIARFHATNAAVVTRLGHSSFHVVQTVAATYVSAAANVYGSSSSTTTVTIRMHIQGV